jgi:SOS response regulatory protein OraA/RecX
MSLNFLRGVFKKRGEISVWSIKMAIKGIPKDIIDEFIEKLSEDKSIDEQRLSSLKKVLYSEDVKKEDISKVLQEEPNDEDS